MNDKIIISLYPEQLEAIIDALIYAQSDTPKLKALPYKLVEEHLQSSLCKHIESDKNQN